MRYLLYARPPGATYPQVLEFGNVAEAEAAMRDYPPATAFRIVWEKVAE